MTEESNGEVRTIVLAGPVGVGKSTLAELLGTQFSLPIVTAVAAIEHHAQRGPLSREELQRAGAQLELEQPGAWLAGAVNAMAGSTMPAVVDAARTAAQVAALRRRGSPTVVVHLSADELVREARYVRRALARDQGVSFRELSASPLEREAESLHRVAELRLDTSDETPAEVLALVLAMLRRLPHPR